MCIYFLFHMFSDKIKRCLIKLCCYLSCIDTIHTFISQMPEMYDCHWSNAKYMNRSRETIPLIRTHQCDSGGSYKRGSTVLNHLEDLFVNAVFILDVYAIL